MPIPSALLVCVVVGISNGDTLTARCHTQTIKVRLAEIDAPEHHQAFGERSKQALAALCFKRTATVQPITTDRYSRTVARVQCNGVDASEQQLRAGMAWVFDRYVADRWLYWAQEDARAARRGLWPDARPVAPWD